MIPRAMSGQQTGLTLRWWCLALLFSLGCPLLAGGQSPAAAPAPECNSAQDKTTSGQLAALRARVEKIENWRSERGSSLPMAAMVAGFGTALVGGVILADEDSDTNAALVAPAVAAVAVGTAGGAAGTFWLVRRNRQRRLHDHELGELRDRLSLVESRLLINWPRGCAAEATRARGAELRHVERALADAGAALKRHPTAGPRVLTVSTAVIGGSLLGLGALMRVGLDVPPGPREIRTGYTLMVSGGLAIAASIWSATWLHDRRRARREIAAEVHTLERRARELLVIPTVSPDFTGMMLRLAF